MRTVKVITGESSGIISMQTAAATWGELQNDFINNNINFMGKRVVLQQGKVDLVSTEAILPSTDINIFLYPTKTESGLSNAEIDELRFNELRTLASELGLVAGSNPTRAFLIEKISVYYLNQGEVLNESSVVEASEDLRVILNDIRRSLGLIAEELGVDLSVKEEDEIDPNEDPLMAEYRAARNV